MPRLRGSLLSSPGLELSLKRGVTEMNFAITVGIDAPKDDIATKVFSVRIDHYRSILGRHLNSERSLGWHAVDIGDRLAAASRDAVAGCDDSGEIQRVAGVDLEFDTGALHPTYAVKVIRGFG